MRLDARGHHAQAITLSSLSIVHNRSALSEVSAPTGRALRRLPAKGQKRGRVEAVRGPSLFPGPSPRSGEVGENSVGSGDGPLRRPEFLDDLGVEHLFQVG